MAEPPDAKVSKKRESAFAFLKSWAILPDIKFNEKKIAVMQEKIQTDRIPSQWVPADIIEKYSVYNYNHALEILTQSFQEEWKEFLEALRHLSISKQDITQAGGNESPIPPKFAAFLEPKQWKEIRISGDLLIKFYPRKGRKGSFAEEPFDQKTIKNYIDGHNIDYVKGRVALDIEWNSKD